MYHQYLSRVALALLYTIQYHERTHLLYLPLLQAESSDPFAIDIVYKSILSMIACAVWSRFVTMGTYVEFNSIIVIVCTNTMANPSMLPTTDRQEWAGYTSLQQ